jgi:hypothetical protein
MNSDLTKLERPLSFLNFSLYNKRFYYQDTANLNLNGVFIVYKKYFSGRILAVV